MLAELDSKRHLLPLHRFGMVNWPIALLAASIAVMLPRAQAKKTICCMPRDMTQADCRCLVQSMCMHVKIGGNTTPVPATSTWPEHLASLAASITMMLLRAHVQATLKMYSAHMLRYAMAMVHAYMYTDWRCCTFVELTGIA